MDLYIKNGIVKNQNEIIIIKDDKQYLNPSKELLESEGWELYVQEITEEEELLMEKEQLKKLILAYDSSESVNEFFYSGFSMWLDKSTRVGLLLRFQSEDLIGKTTTNLWYNGVSFTLSVKEALQILYFLEIYASACYDNTQAHLKAVDSLTSIEEVVNYDYTLNYPEKLKF